MYISCNLIVYLNKLLSLKVSLYAPVAQFLYCNFMLFHNYLYILWFPHSPQRVASPQVEGAAPPPPSWGCHLMAGGAMERPPPALAPTTAAHTALSPPHVSEGSQHLQQEGYSGASELVWEGFGSPHWTSVLLMGISGVAKEGRGGSLPQAALFWGDTFGSWYNWHKCNKHLMLISLSLLSCLLY